MPAMLEVHDVIAGIAGRSCGRGSPPWRVEPPGFPDPCACLYSPEECVEEEFCELRLYEVLGSLIGGARARRSSNVRA